jgi:hypothetical protein
MYDQRIIMKSFYFYFSLFFVNNGMIYPGKRERKGVTLLQESPNLVISLIIPSHNNLDIFNIFCICKYVYETYDFWSLEMSSE